MQGSFVIVTVTAARRLRTAKIARLPPLPISLSSDGTETIGYEVFVVGNLELEGKMTPL